MKTPNDLTRLAIAAMLLVLAGCEKAPEGDLSTILARHTEARGGAAALEAVQAIEVTRQVQEGSREFTTHYVATRDGRMRFDVKRGDVTVFSEGFDGQSAWQQRGRHAPAEEMPDWALAAVKRALRHNLYALHELSANGTELVLGEREKISGSLYYWVIDAKDPDGYARRLFLDPYDFFVTKVEETTALNPDQTNYPSEQYTFFSDFREVNGVSFSFKSETRRDEDGQTLQMTIAKDIIVNPDFDPSIFERPADDEALRDQDAPQDGS